MNIYDIIDKKRHNLSLTKEEIDYFVFNYTNDNIKDYQASALLMAIAINGMNDEEISNLTIAMTNSGDRIDLSNLNNTIDKHSSGGVGDKTTLIISPIIACLGGSVAKMSGRGLGYTGGTIDKLESIGMNVTLSNQEFIKQVKDIGLAVVSQTANLALADKKIYALRDVTATVDSIPLIASSIMSKKIAGSSKNLVLDVKVGTGAFMKDVKEATKLGEKMVMIAKTNGINATCILTNMNEPLGNKIGNALEVMEAIEVLKNKGPEDLKEISICLATHMNMLINNIDYNEARKQVVEVLENGMAYNKFVEWVNYQGGDLNSQGKVKFYEVKSENDGYISSMDTEVIGKVSCMLGCGRSNKDDIIDYFAGIVLKAKTGDYVKKGSTVAVFYTNKENVDELIKYYLSSLTFSNKKVKREKLILKVIK